ncbi:MAG: FtsX-like permease family protein [Actinomycetota bacterium]|nr:FtsX-like permease family protein [Actinomycetota bacterium]
MFTVILKSAMARKLRFAMTGAAVVIGVSFMAGTFILTDSINATFTNIFTQPAAGRDTTVRARSAFRSTGVVAVDVQRGPVPGSLVDTISHVPGVRFAAGTVQGYAQLVGKDGMAVRAERAPMIGTNWIPQVELSLSRIASGHGPVDAHQVAIDARTFKRQGFHLGDRVTVLSTQSPRQFTIVGSLVFGGSDSPGGATVVAFDGPTAQAMVGHPGSWDEIEAAAVRPIRAGALTQRINGILPPQYEAATSASVAAALAKSVQNALGRLPTILLIFAGVSVFAGLFIVYNTFSILVSHRSREIALLLAIGASRGQITSSIMCEAAVIGMLASGLGLGVGAFVALGMERVFTATGFGLPASDLHVVARTVVVSLLVGTAATMVSAIIPSRRASRTAPVAAMTQVDLGAPVSCGNPSATGMLLTMAGLALVFAGLLVHPKRILVVALGATLVFIGLATLIPPLVVPLARVVGAPARAWGGMTGRLSQENAMRNPRRTAATAAALMIGVALVSIIGIMGASVKGTSARTIHNSVRADQVVSTTGGGFLSGATLNGFSADLAAQLRNRPELAAVAEIRAGFWHRGGSLEYLSAIDTAAAPRIINFRLSAGSLANLANGEVLVDASLAKIHHVRLGDRMAMGFEATGTQNLIVGGMFTPNEFVESYVISLATYEANYPKAALDQELLILDRSGAAPSVRAIRHLVDPYRNLEVQSPAGLKATEQRRLDTVVNLGYVLMAFSIVVALIGIVNTLALSVMERTREIGLLRAVGMQRVQVRRMVRGESIQVCLIGAILGLAVGTGLGLALVSALSFGTDKVVSVPAAPLVVVVVLATLAGVVAAIVPARRAARLDVLQAIAVT